MKARRPSQSLPATNSAQADSGEGGLELGQVLAAIRRRAILIAGVTTVVASGAVFKALTDTPTYSAGFEILTKPVTIETEVISSVPQTLSSRRQEATVTLDTTTIRVLQSSALLMPIVEELKSDYPTIEYGTIIQGLSIAVSEQSILGVTYTNPDPELLKAILKLLSEAYLKYSLEDRQQDIQQGITFVEEQLPQLEARVSGKQEDLQRFRQKYNLIDPQSQATQLTEQAGAFSREALDNQTKLDEARLLYAELQAQLANPSTEIATSSALTNSPRYQQLLNQILAIDSQISQDSALYLDESPEISILRTQRENLLPLLQAEGERVEREVASRIEELENRNRALNRSINFLNQRIKQLSAITREFTDIQRELEISTENLNQFLTKREALRIDAAQRQIPWQLLTPPGEPHPTAASVKRNLILGIVLGLFMGTGVALLVDSLSGVIHTAKEVKDITKLPLLGVIPFNKQIDEEPASRGIMSWLHKPQRSLELNGHQSHQPTFTPFLEVFRSIYVNIQLINPDQPVRSLVISSATPSSGKTTIAANLAQAAAAMGQRVLLVDTDLRHPSLHHHLKLTNTQGLVDVISHNIEFKEAIEPIAWEPNLFVMAAGAIPPDPTRILSSKTMQRVMETCHTMFDLVIYDTPPLVGFADAHLLSAYTDGILLVVRLGQMKRSPLEQALEELRISKAVVLGAIANGSQDGGMSAYHHYQYYAQDDDDNRDNDDGVWPSIELPGKSKVRLRPFKK